MQEGRFLKLRFKIVLNNKYEFEVRAVIRLYCNEELIPLRPVNQTSTKIIAKINEIQQSYRP
jgi:hypothetical protein